MKTLHITVKLLKGGGRRQILLIALTLIQMKKQNPTGFS